MKLSHTFRGWLVGSFLALLVGPIGTAWAAQLSITDCEGVPRAARQVEEEQPQTVRLRTSSQGAIDFKVTLNNDSGTVKNAAVGQGGVVTFPHVAPGNWKICGIPQDVSLDDIEIVPVEETNTLRVAAVTGGTLIVSGIALGSQGSSSETVTDTGQPPATSGNSGLVGPIQKEEPPIVQQQTVAAAKKPRPFSPAEDGLDDEEASAMEPISPAS